MTSTNTELATANHTFPNCEARITNPDMSAVNIRTYVSNLASGPTSSGSTSAAMGGKRPLKASEQAKFNGSDTKSSCLIQSGSLHYLWVSCPSSEVDEQIKFLISCPEGKTNSSWNSILSRTSYLGHQFHDFTIWMNSGSSSMHDGMYPPWLTTLRPNLGPKHTKSVQSIPRTPRCASRTLAITMFPYMISAVMASWSKLKRYTWFRSLITVL